MILCIDSTTSISTVFFFFNKGQFQKAIMQSGCAFNPWAFNKNHKEVAFKLAELLGCQKKNPIEIVEYLRNVPAIDLIKAASSKMKFEVCKRKIQNMLCIGTINVNINYNKDKRKHLFH